jgi:hypothetical protein
MLLRDTTFVHLSKSLLQNKKGLDLDTVRCGSRRDTGSAASEYVYRLHPH